MNWNCCWTPFIIRSYIITLKYGLPLPYTLNLDSSCFLHQWTQYALASTALPATSLSKVFTKISRNQPLNHLPCTRFPFCSLNTLIAPFLIRTLLT
jgi:hypothetical protein